VLLLENPTKPDWVWQWQHADFGLGDGRPDDLLVWRANGRGHGYVCNFNQIEVYSAPLPPGRSILPAREVFREVAFRTFDDGGYVDATFTEREDSKQLIDVHLRLSRRVELGGQDTVRLFYVAEAGAGRLIQEMNRYSFKGTLREVMQRGGVQELDLSAVNNRLTVRSDLRCR
jgi:hypothetical protein